MEKDEITSIWIYNSKSKTEPIDCNCHASKIAGQHLKKHKFHPLSDSWNYLCGENQQFTDREEDNVNRQASETESNQTEDCT